MKELVSYKMNLPADIDRWIRLEAAKECRSRSGHIIRILRNAMEATAGESLGNYAPAAAEIEKLPSKAASLVTTESEFRND